MILYRFYQIELNAGGHRGGRGGRGERGPEGERVQSGAGVGDALSRPCSCCLEIAGR